MSVRNYLFIGLAAACIGTNSSAADRGLGWMTPEFGGRCDTMLVDPSTGWRFEPGEDGGRDVYSNFEKYQDVWFRFETNRGDPWVQSVLMWASVPSERRASAPAGLDDWRVEALAEAAGRSAGASPEQVAAWVLSMRTLDLQDATAMKDKVFPSGSNAIVFKASESSLYELQLHVIPADQLLPAAE